MAIWSNLKWSALEPDYSITVDDLRLTLLKATLSAERGSLVRVLSPTTGRE
jgi:hypothetical protein